MAPPLTNTTATITGPSNTTTTKKKRVEARAKMAEEAGLVDYARNLRDHHIGWTTVEDDMIKHGDGERNNTKTQSIVLIMRGVGQWTGQPPADEDWYKRSLADYVSRQREAALKWANLQGEKVRRQAEEAAHAAAAGHLEEQRRLLFQQPAVKRARHHNRLVDEAARANGYIRIKPESHAKPWNREGRHHMRKNVARWQIFQKSAARQEHPTSS
jgi:hypothetical protein